MSSLACRISYRLATCRKRSGKRTMFMARGNDEGAILGDEYAKHESETQGGS